MRSRRAGLVLVSLLVSCALLELGARALRGRIGAEPAPDTGAAALPLSEPGAAAQGWKLHPYSGFIINAPGERFGSSGLVANDQGFVSERGDYPVLRERPQQYLVGVFGGSVAQQLFTQGRRRLAERLAASPLLAGREPVVLAFAQPGFKQPQQLLLLAQWLALGQPLDLIVNLDGFNDVALAERNFERGLDPDMPNAGHMLPMIEQLDASTLTPERVELLARLQRGRRELAELNAWRGRTPSAAVGLALDAWRRTKAEHLRRELEAWDTLPSRAAASRLFHLSPLRHPIGRAELFEHAAQVWSEASRLMLGLARAQGAGYLHVLQPNQYHSRRRFTDSERAAAWDEKHLYRQAVVDGYPALLGRVAWLREQGVPFASAIDALDGLREPAYIDSCCHLTLPGVERLAEFVADAALATGAAGPG